MHGSKVICLACHCHVRSGERACPHCRADLTATGATRTPRRRAVQMRRLLFATAVAGLGTTSCGGRIYGDASATEQPAPGATFGPSTAAEREIAGECLHGDGTLGHCGPLSPALADCTCGPAGDCIDDLCVTRSCESGEYLDEAGVCTGIDWFGSEVPSSNSCYGCPPYLG
jgi:hypothetical protein